MIVLGVDPGLGCTGYGVVARQDRGAASLIECGVIRTSPDATLPQRLREIFEAVGELVDRRRPDVAAVEGVFYGRNVRTTVVLGHARAAALLAASLRDVPIAEYAPAEVKNAIAGTGRATKDQMQYMVQQLLRLRTPPRPSDAADGVAVALCHLSAFRIPRLSDLAQTP